MTSWKFGTGTTSAWHFIHEPWGLVLTLVQVLKVPSATFNPLA